MNGGNPNERLLKFLQATPEQQAAIDRILAGKMYELKGPTGPLLMPLSVGAKFLGISRSTLARMIQAGKLSKVEILPGYFGVRRTDLEAIAAKAIRIVEKHVQDANRKQRGNPPKVCVAPTESTGVALN